MNILKILQVLQNPSNISKVHVGIWLMTPACIGGGDKMECSDKLKGGYTDLK
jgi:hypothetical protein